MAVTVTGEEWLREADKQSCSAEKKRTILEGEDFLIQPHLDWLGLGRSGWL